MTPDRPETDLRVGPDGGLVVDRRVDRQAVVAAVVDEVRRERPDRVGTEAATLGGGREEEVDAGVAEVGFGLLGRLDVADARRRRRGSTKPSSSGSTAGQVRLDAGEVERAPPARDRGLGEDRGQAPARRRA